MIPLGNTARIEGYGTPTERNGSVSRVRRQPVKFPTTQSPPPTQPKHTCPQCGEQNIHRSRRRLREKMVNWLHPNQRMFRCYRCHYRFWDIYEKNPSQPVAETSPSLKVVSNQSRSSNGRPYREVDPDIPFFLRINQWLYRKYSLTIGTVFILMLLGSIVFAGLLWALEQLSS